MREHPVGSLRQFVHPETCIVIKGRITQSANHWCSLMDSEGDIFDFLDSWRIWNPKYLMSCVLKTNLMEA